MGFFVFGNAPKVELLAEKFRAFFHEGCMVRGVMKKTIVREIDSLQLLYAQRGNLNAAVVQGLNLCALEIDWEGLECEGAVFLGGCLPTGVAELLMSKGALVFPKIPHLPYRPYRNSLYTREELREGWTHEQDYSLDLRIYEHFVEQGKGQANVLELLAQRLHDHAIDDALADLLEGRVEPGGEKKVVAIMGGHGTSRTDLFFKKVAEIARDLTRDGYFIASGGGPGMMEATNLGAWLAPYEDVALDDSLKIMAVAPIYSDPDYQRTADEVVQRYPDGASSLAVPTWFYGHEPTNSFSMHIAKYFSNSIREDGLLAIAKHGVVYSPGSAGTTQEIFMDATQNHYVTFDYVSPMVFLGKKRYSEDTMLFPCLEQLARGRDYAKGLLCTDEVSEVVHFIQKNPPFRP